MDGAANQQGGNPGAARFSAHEARGSNDSEAGAGAGAGAGSGAGADIEEIGCYQPLWVRLACIFLDFLTQTYDQIRIVPEIVLFERWLCDAYFPGHGAQSHELCKTPDIQYELARLRSWKALFDGIASMYRDQEFPDTM